MYFVTGQSGKPANVSQAILNGEDGVLVGFQVAIETGQKMCGGIILSDTWVLSAGSCTET